VFTGLIEEVGVVSRITRTEVAILATKVLEDIALGDSVSVDGACLTVVAYDGEGLVAEVSPETLERTTLGRVKPGWGVNLERAARVGDRLGGHFVLGHVDGVGRVESVDKQGKFSLWRFQAPADVSRYLVPKGSVAVDGISLTVVEPAGETFGVAIIPATIENTTLPNRNPGDPVNLEADILGKHVYHYLAPQMKDGASGDISVDFLSRHGFA
jgi:riboflavin synthase